jgi:hypothetical protein
MTKSSSPKGASRKARTAKSSSKRTRRNKTALKVVAENVRGAYRATARKVSAEKARDTWNATALLEQFPGTQMPNTFRALAEQNVAHTRELYERSKNTLQAVLDSWQKSFGAAGQGAATLNRKLIDLAERNINTGFDFATGLAGARDFGEVMELQAAYWRKVLGELRTQKGGRAQSSKARGLSRN